AISTSGPWTKARNRSAGTRIPRIRPQLGFGGRSQSLLAELPRRPNKGMEKRMRLHGLGLELGVELAAQIPRVAGNLADLHVSVVRGLAGDAQASGRQSLFVLAVEFVAVAVPFVDLARAGGGVRARVCGHPGGAR